ncbi:MAG TPA: prepilin-type N-terminal cleavage/methylation domain-containing protein [Bryobacteraceae bacterium]|nr:prepilin-type N-terminal cleavage/methylation domain-containing protein [Bryobacteraceae bacterium]
MKRPNQAGVTLIELLIVVTIIAVVVGVSFPAITAGLAGLRLTTASGSVASFLTSSMNRVDRREEAAAIVVSPKDNLLAVYTAASGEKPARSLELPQGIQIEGSEPRRYLLMPGGTAPRMTVVLRNEKGARKSIRIDPVTAVPDIR